MLSKIRRLNSGNIGGYALFYPGGLEPDIAGCVRLVNPTGAASRCQAAFIASIVALGALHKKPIAEVLAVVHDLLC
jgi:hypothetical protein